MMNKTKHLSSFVVLGLIIPLLFVGLTPGFDVEETSEENIDCSEPCVDDQLEMISYRDSSGNKIAEPLEIELQDIEGEITVIVLLSEPPMDSDIDNFEGYGGVVTKGPWEDVIYGFAGSIDSEDVLQYARSCERILEIEKEQEFDYHLYFSSNMVRARNYVYSDLGYTGSGDTSLAFIDTGIDPDHTAFSPGYLGEGDFDGKIVGWHDASGSHPTPRDSGGHGQHCAGIAAANGFAEIDSQGRLVTHHGWSTTLGSIEYPEPPVIYVDEPGEIEINFACLHDVNSGGFSYMALKYLGEEPVPAEFDSNTEYIENWEEVAREDDLVQTPDLRTTTDRNWNTLTYEVDSSELGFYRVATYRTSVSGGIGQGLRYVFRIHTPTSMVDSNGVAPDGFGTFTGIAPDSKLTIVSGGMFVGTSTWLEGLNYIMQNRESQHITTVSMSLGTSSDDSSVRNAISNTWNAGIIIVAAAGNDGPGGSMSYPGRYSPVIGVAATQAGGNISYYSSRGVENNGDGYTKPDIAAPGGSIRFQGGVMSAGAYSGYPPTQWGRVPEDLESMYPSIATTRSRC